MNKKGMEWGLVYIFSIFLIAIFFFTFFLYQRNNFEMNEEIINENIDNMKTNHYFLSYLDEETQYGRISDLIIIGYLTDDFSILEQETGKYFNTDGEINGWEIYIEKKKLSKDFISSKVFFDEKTIIPGADREPLEIRLRLSSI